MPPFFSTTIPKSKPITSTQSIITREKVSMFKPKPYLTTHNILEPSTTLEALFEPKWKKAIQVEYDALIKKLIGVLCLCPLTLG